MPRSRDAARAAIRFLCAGMTSIGASLHGVPYAEPDGDPAPRPVRRSPGRPAAAPLTRAERAVFAELTRQFRF